MQAGYTKVEEEKRLGPFLRGHKKDKKVAGYHKKFSRIRSALAALEFQN